MKTRLPTLMLALSVAGCAGLRARSGARPYLSSRTPHQLEDLIDWVRRSSGHDLTKDGDPAVVLARRLRAGMPLLQATHAMGEQFGLSEPLAEDLAFFSFVALVEPDVHGDDEELDPALRAAAIEAAYRVLSVKPGLVDVWGVLSIITEHSCYDARFLDLLFRRPIDFAGEVYVRSGCEGVLKLALAKAPETPWVLRELHGREKISSATAIVIAERWRQALLRRGASGADQPLAQATASLIADLVEAGLAEDAVALVDGLPADQREHALGAHAKSYREAASFYYVVALIASDRLPEARAYSTQAEPGTRGPEKASRSDVRWKALRALIERGDAFEVPAHSYWPDPPFLLHRDLARLYDSQGFSGLADHERQILRQLAVELRALAVDEDLRLYAAPLGDSFLARRLRYAERIESAIADAWQGAPADQPGETEELFLGRPIRRHESPFREIPLAEAEPYGSGCRTLDLETDPRLRDFQRTYAAKAQSCRGTLVVVDGLCSWLMISADDGKTWKHVSTGLGQASPYRLREHSRVPLLENGVVRLHVDVREIKEPSHYSIMTTYRRRVDDVLATAPLDALERDSDGDGITDLTEKQLHLDPVSADTDGDGIPDGEDRLPNVANGEPHIAADVLGQALVQVFVSLHGEAPPADAMMFVVADPELFRGAQLPFGVVVLSRQQALELVNPWDLDLEVQGLSLSKDGTRAILGWASWDEWGGRATYFEKEGSSWRAEDLGKPRTPTVRPNYPP